MAAGKGGGDKTRSLEEGTREEGTRLALDAPLASACQSHSMLMAALV